MHPWLQYTANMSKQERCILNSLRHVLRSRTLPNGEIVSLCDDEQTSLRTDEHWCWLQHECFNNHEHCIDKAKIDDVYTILSRRLWSQTRHQTLVGVVRKASIVFNSPDSVSVSDLEQKIMYKCEI